jgi:hypothetical protein
MKRALLTGCILICICISGLAWLDATEKQCEARYGKPQPAQTTNLGSDKTLRYRKEGAFVTADFIKGKCVKIEYGLNEELRQEHIDTFFNLNGGTSAWSHVKGGSGNDYVRVDGLAKAVVSPGLNGNVTFFYDEWQKAHDQAIKDREEAKKTAEKERLKKFSQDF